MNTETGNRLLRSCCTVFAISIFAVPLMAQNCLQDEYTASGQSQKLNCTANDVRIAEVTNIRDPLTGATLTSCIQGARFNFIADFEIVTSSDKPRENIGLYIATSSTTQALTGSCVDNIVSPQHQCPSAASGILCGSDNYHEADAAPDNCGDTSKLDNSGTFGAAAQKVTLEIDNFLCVPPAGSTTLVLPNCTSWQVPGKQLFCYSPPPNYPYETAAIPGSPSKCNCAVIPLPITPVTPTVTVAKSCNTALSTGTGLVSCDAGVEGSTVTYHVGVNNTTNFGDIVVDQICDSAYGRVFRASTFTGPACLAGSVGSIASTTCSALDIAQGGSGSCDFTAVQGELASVTDILSVSGHSGISTGQTFGPTESNSVTVVSEDAPTTATVTKGWTANLSACINVRYNVDFTNTSGADESLTLTTLTDNSFGEIAPTKSASILGTTCVMPQTIAPGGKYDCTFDAQICGNLTNITLPGGGACTGFTHSNTVSGTTTLEDTGTGASYTETDHGLTLNECISATPVSQ